MVAFLIVPLLLYAAVCAGAWLYQDRMLFPAPPARPDLPAGGERLALTASDGVALAGLRLRPVAPDAAAPVLLVFGGNGWNADDAADYVHTLFPASETIAFHYRGYPPSGGRPSSRALEADSLLAWDAAARIAAGRPVVAVGFSIGSAVAAHLASRRPVAGLILVTPFDSLTQVAAASLPWLPVRALFRNPMEPAAALSTSRVPTAILAAGRDTLVAPARTDALRRAVPRLVYDRTLPGAGHNDIYQRPAFREDMRQAMQAVLAAPPGH